MRFVQDTPLFQIEGIHLAKQNIGQCMMECKHCNTLGMFLGIDCL